MKYAFLDRDGTILFEPPTDYNVVSAEMLPGVEEALKQLQENGYQLVIVSNQDGLGTPMNPQNNFDRVQTQFLKDCKERGIEFSEILWCPHKHEEECECRKPKTGLLNDFDISSDSIVIGDRASDVELAKNLGIKGVKVETNKGFSYEDTQK